MSIYRAKAGKIKGTDFHEVWKEAYGLYIKIKKQSKRKPYIKSEYFNKEKVFLSLFWTHLFGKENWKDRMRRLKYYATAIELIRYNKFHPTSRANPNRPDEILYRFTGLTKEEDVFYVQIKENKHSRRKDMISIFPKK